MKHENLNTPEPSIIYKERVYGTHLPGATLSGLYRCPVCHRTDADIFHINSCKPKEQVKP